MATIDERVAYLEGQVESQLRGIDDLRDMVRQVDARVVALDLKVDQRLLRLDDKMSRQFVWVVGIQVAVLIAVLGALVGT